MLSVALLVIQCGLVVDEAVLDAIIQRESRGNPLAINVNGEMELVHQPRDREEAVLMARWLEAHGYDFDAGLGQVNVRNFAWLGLDVTTVFDPCANLRASNRVLRECYGRAAERWGDGDAAVTAALSCYNTGDFARGVWNGYVRAVRARATRPLVITRESGHDEAAGVCWANAPAARPPRKSKERERRRPAESGGSGDATPDVFAEPLADAFAGRTAVEQAQ